MSARITYFTEVMVFLSASLIPLMV